MAYKDSKGVSHAIAADRKYSAIPAVGDSIELLPATDTDEAWDEEVERRELTESGLVEIFVDAGEGLADRQIAALRTAGFT